MRSSRSYTVTEWPAARELLGRRQAGRAASRRSPPCGPSPPARGCGTTQPSSQARSTIACSTCLIVTARSLSVEDARLLARRRAELARELGEVVRRVQPVDGGAPLAAVHEVVPVRDQVAERAARVAERHAAVHAALRLLAHEAVLGGRLLLRVVAQPVLDRAVRLHAAAQLQEPARVSHRPPPTAARRCSARSASTPPQVVRHHLHEAAQRRVPVGQQPARDAAAR